VVTSEKPAKIDLVCCEVCLKEVPIAEAMVPEASDYFVHFCGLECYEKWKSQVGKPKEQAEKGGS
jgi:Domain of unknown function (DUF3330)